MSLIRLQRFIQTRMGERGGIVHSIGTLVGGTAFAQALAILVLPLLTRLYTPAEFSVLAVYASLLAILSVVACLRLEIAIPLPKRDKVAASLLALALTSSLAFSLIVGLIAWLLNAPLVRWIGVPAFAPYLWMVPLGVWVASSYAAFQFWATRKKRFPRIASTRMVQALSGAGIQIGAGWLGAGLFGLLLGHMANGGAGLVGLARDVWRQDRLVMRGVSVASMRAALARYARFPKYSALEALANNTGVQLPVIIIASLAVGPEAGYLMLASKVMVAPMSLMGGAVAQVYLAHAPEELRKGRLAVFTEQILVGLVKTGVGPLLFAGIVAAPAFAIVFGSEWRRAGELVTWMTPWFILQFVSSPVSMVMHVTNRQRAMLVVTVAGLFIRLGAILIAYQFARGSFSELYACSGAVFYLICCVVFYRSAGIALRSAFVRMISAASPVLAWAAAGVVARVGMEIIR